MVTLHNPGQPAQPCRESPSFSSLSFMSFPYKGDELVQEDSAERIW